MIWIKGCPKCKGELTDNKDTFGYYIYCVQCGYQLTESQIGKIWTYTLNHSAAFGIRPGREVAGVSGK